MAMSGKERLRILRERRQMELEAAPDRSAEWMKASFSKFIGERIMMLDESLDALGVRLEGDNFLRSERQRFHSDGVEGDITMSALERATALAIEFVNAGKELAELVNEFKVGEITARIVEIENSDLSDPDKRKTALESVVELKEILKELQRERRTSLRPVEVK